MSQETRERKGKTVICDRCREIPDGNVVMDRGGENDCSEEEKCCSLIIWLFMQNAESPPIRAGDL